MKLNTIIQGDCLEKLKEISDNSIDSIVTDPPYELGFMGKSWDNTGIANSIDMWAECLRVLKPGGHLLAFSGTRTYHRMAVAIEDAGFEVRDMIEWVYGSGFPKSLNIGKAVDKLQGNEREVLGTRLVPDQRGGGINSERTAAIGVPTRMTTDTKGTSEWEGWGTALKPAHEPICMARKPLAEKTVAENCLKWGCGGINIDESRVGLQEGEKKVGGFGNEKIGFQDQSKDLKRNVEWKENTQARFPANLIHDNSEEVRECFPETGKSTGGRIGNKGSALNMMGQDYEAGDPGYGDSGNASRFFKSIKQDLHCSLCYDTIYPYQLTKNICNNTNVNNVEKSLTTTQATTESTALKNATGKVNENLVQNVKSAGNLCDLCGTSIAQRLVAIMQDQNQELTLGVLSMPEHKKQILEKCLVSFVELRGNTDTIPTMENLNLLFGYVLNAIEEYTQRCEDTRNEEKSQWKSLIYKSKASKSERNEGCEGLEEKSITSAKGNGLGRVCNICGTSQLKPCECENNTWILPVKNKNNHPTVKPLALMEYLIRMVTPKGGVVLDPFTGSGSTLVAAKKLGFNFLGIEKEKEYIDIAEARLKVLNQGILL